MADLVNAARAAEQEIRESMAWLEHEIRVWRCLGAEPDEEGEQVLFRDRAGMDLDQFIERMRTAQYILNRALTLKPETGDSDHA